MPSQEIMEKYDAVRTSLENAMKVSDNIQLNGEEENQELQYIRNTLNQLNKDFKAEIEKLENSSEWDKFCIAFFGETNAGKSTIIESLRIVYDEEARREKINRHNEQYQKELKDEMDKYNNLVQSLTQLNESIEMSKDTKAKNIIKVFGLIMIGMVIGFAIACFVL